jgi:aminoglycoside/choline kinase family phosphotransferase
VAHVSDQVLQEFTGRSLGLDASGAVVRKLKGDASNRSYYRVTTSAGPFVVMAMPLGPAGSEEATKGGPPPELPFVNVHRYLDGLGVRVPRILRYEESAGLMLLEDLGDVTFEAALQGGSREELYGKAVDLLALLRAQADRHVDPACLAFTRAFDRELYRWELDHFYIWGLVARTGRQPTTPEREALDRAFDHVANALDGLPRGFTHRDYQSRNLMVLPQADGGGEIVVIDFQDALQGPRQYDLVALLRDSYVELDRAFVETMVARYCDELERHGVAAGDRAAFLKTFDLMTIQRKLKDGGRPPQHPRLVPLREAGAALAPRAARARRDPRPLRARDRLTGRCQIVRPRPRSARPLPE